MSVPAEQLHSDMTLAELLHGYVDAPDTVVRGISSDSRNLQDGDLFLACQGLTNHGVDFIDDAIAAGVAAIAYDSATAELPERDYEVPGERVGNEEDVHGEAAESAERILTEPYHPKTGARW